MFGFTVRHNRRNGYMFGFTVRHTPAFGHPSPRGDGLPHHTYCERIIDYIVKKPLPRHPLSERGGRRPGCVAPLNTDVLGCVAPLNIDNQGCVAPSNTDNQGGVALSNTDNPGCVALSNWLSVGSGQSVVSILTQWQIYSFNSGLVLICVLWRLFLFICLSLQCD